MGTALEWLSSTGCKSVAMEILSHPEQPKYGRPEIWAHCPFHSERTPGGAFSYNYEKDQAKCQSCGATGDLITVYSQIHGLSKEDGFLEFKKKYGKDMPYQAQGPGRKAQGRGTAPVPENYFAKDHKSYTAPEKWIERAGSFVEHSQERLMNSEKALIELENRWGINPSTALKLTFGMNDQDKWVPLSSWGLGTGTAPLHAPGKDVGAQSTVPAQKEKKIWLPKGLVMPCMVNDHVRKIKIRRPDPATSWGEPRRYWEVQGGENYRFHCYSKEQSAKSRAQIVVVLEAERDAALVWQECSTVFDNALVAVAGGGAAKRPHDAEVMALIKAAEVILVALDNDEPGRLNAVNFWEKEFGAAKYWPTPKTRGKDASEAFKGLDIRAWIMAGLPERFKNKFKI